MIGLSVVGCQSIPRLRRTIDAIGPYKTHMHVLALLFALALPQSDNRQLTTDNPTIGYSAIHLESGRRVSERGAEAFPMGSVYKFPVGVSVLRRVDAGTMKLDEKITITEFSPGHSPLRDRAKGKPITVTLGELVALMVRDSDNTPCDYFIERIGAETITKEIGIAGIRVDRTERVIAKDIARDGRDHYANDPRDTATPDAMAQYLAKMGRAQLGLSKSSHDLLMRLMTETKTGPRRIKSALPKGAQLAHKTGTMPGTVNDVGIITTADGQHVAVAIFTKRGPSDQKSQEKAIAARTADILSRLLDTKTK